MTTQVRFYANPAEVIDFADALLIKAGLPEDHAILMAKCLVQADTHGVISLAQGLAVCFFE